MSELPASEAEPAQEEAAFYRRAMRLLNETDVPFLVGGAYAFEEFTGIARHTKDIDLFVRKADLDAVVQVFEAAGFRTEAQYAHWLAKAYEGDASIDVVYGSGNGLATVDDGWFERAVAVELLGVDVRLCPPEEILWTKAYIWSVSAMTVPTWRTSCAVVPTALIGSI